MANEYANFSNDEIRQAYIRLSGDSSCGPVTELTRNSYLKKLRDLGSKQVSGQTRQLTVSVSVSEVDIDEDRDAGVPRRGRGRPKRTVVAALPPTNQASGSAQVQIKKEPQSDKAESDRRRIKNESERQPAASSYARGASVTEYDNDEEEGEEEEQDEAYGTMAQSEAFNPLSSRLAPAAAATTADLTFRKPTVPSQSSIWGQQVDRNANTRMAKANCVLPAAIRKSPAPQSAEESSFKTRDVVKASFSLFLCAVFILLLMSYGSFWERRSAMRIDQSQVMSSTLNSPWQFRYCETYRVDPKRCVEPAVAQRVLDIAERIVTDWIFQNSCESTESKVDWLNISQFRESLKLFVDQDFLSNAEYLVVLLAESLADSTFHFLRQSGEPVQLPIDSSGVVTPELAAISFVKATQELQLSQTLRCYWQQFLNLLHLCTRLALFTSVFIVIFVAWRIRKNRLVAEQERVYALADRIFQQLHSCAETKQWQSLRRVRDAVTESRDRDWKAAVALLREDSRVRFALRRIIGEDDECECIRLAESQRDKNVKQFKLRPFSQQCERIMQTLPSSIVRLPADYRCLKISLPCDPLSENGGDHRAEIEDEILRKCISLKSGFVNHIFVDCPQHNDVVYLKFSNAEATREAREVLNGCLFDNRVATAKYVPMDRYLNRFADARSTDSVHVLPSNA